LGCSADFEIYISATTMRKRDLPNNFELNFGMRLVLDLDARTGE
jgi:hypothetical protein